MGGARLSPGIQCGDASSGCAGSGGHTGSPGIGASVSLTEKVPHSHVLSECWVTEVAHVPQVFCGERTVAETTAL